MSVANDRLRSDPTDGKCRPLCIKSERLNADLNLPFARGSINSHTTVIRLCYQSLQLNTFKDMPALDVSEYCYPICFVSNNDRMSIRLQVLLSTKEGFGVGRGSVIVGNLTPRLARVSNGQFIHAENVFRVHDLVQRPSQRGSKTTASRELTRVGDTLFERSRLSGMSSETSPFPLIAPGFQICYTHLLWVQGKLTISTLLWRVPGSRCRQPQARASCVN